MKKHKKRFATVSVLLVAILTFGFIQSDPYFLIKKNFTIFSEVYDEVSKRYVEEIEPESMMRHGINSMLQMLDPYTVIIDEAESQEMDIVTTGQYAGVGLEVGARAGKLVVIAPIEGYSADRRGIKAGDIIISVNGISTDDMSMDELQSLLRGEPGSTVSMTTRRYGLDQDLTFELTRERIEIKNVAHASLLDPADFKGIIEPEQRIGYILMRRFAQNASDELRRAILALQEEGELDGLILDLRNNPGGLLDEAVHTVDKFIEPGNIVVKTRGRMPETNSEYRTREPAIYKNPLIVLQNGGSASSSEIVSGALQDLDRAVVVGERSFGKGLVQIVRPLSYNLSIKITTSKYYTPSGRSIQSLRYASEEQPDTITVPDSVRKPFETKKGRTVYEGIGIEPDFHVDRPQPSLLEVALLQNSHYFFFANQFIAENDTFDQDYINDDLFENFRRYLDKAEFDFETRSERYYSRFHTSLKDEIRENAGSQLAYIEGLIQKEKNLELEQKSEEIKRELLLELISRFNGTDGRLRSALRYDEDVLQGLELLAKPSEYKSVLNQIN